MCGLWGFITRRPVPATDVKKMIHKLMCLSESRGKEAAGLAIMTGRSVRVFKRALPASEMMKTADYNTFINHALCDAQNEGFAVIGHSRMVTNGTQTHADNNQPVVGRQFVTVHNGIIVNDEALWQNISDIQPKSEVDTEVFVALCEQYLESASLLDAIKKTYADIIGMASTLSLVAGTGSLVAATNSGSLYYCQADDDNSMVFMSERFSLKKLVAQNALANKLFKSSNIHQLYAGEGLCYTLAEGTPLLFGLSNAGDGGMPPSGHGDLSVRAITVDKDGDSDGTFTSPARVTFHQEKYKKFEIDEAPIRLLRRCTRCVLPETMPFIEFDEEGVCNYCKTYKKHQYKGEEALAAWADSVRKTDGSADTIVSFSGGRDSSYGLHYFVKELGLHPVAFSYDWGMLTDLARRNQSRMCAALGVEHVLVSADIKKKRSFIRKNILAWLKKPDLGLVPLFMAGDKQYFYYANKVRKEYDLNSIQMAINPFEKTHFKTAFCNVKPAVLKENKKDLYADRQSFGDILRMSGHYLKNYITNPSYINASLLDTVGATFSFYLIPHNYVRLFTYIPWDEDEVNRVLLDEYDWETSPDTQSTWRIGDGTAPFYNYIYYLVAGFTENDTLRSNQIREGVLSREKGLELIYRDNAARFESLQWYFDVEGLDMDAVLKRVSKIPRLYEKYL